MRLVMTITQDNMSLISKILSEGLELSHFCYHRILNLVGSCRLCILEFRKSIKPMAACITDTVILPNENLYNLDSPLVKKARENVLEFVLGNHPLDCPNCDQGGTCDLQEESDFFGVSKRRFNIQKMGSIDSYFGPYIHSNMNRCIHCGKCIRFTQDYINFNGVAMLGRSEKTVVGTYNKPKAAASELSGNIVEICSVSRTLITEESNVNKTSKSPVPGEAANSGTNVPIKGSELGDSSSLAVDLPDQAVSDTKDPSIDLPDQAVNPSIDLSDQAANSCSCIDLFINKKLPANATETFMDLYRRLYVNYGEPSNHFSRIYYNDNIKINIYSWNDFKVFLGSIEINGTSKIFAFEFVHYEIPILLFIYIFVLVVFCFSLFRRKKR